VSDNALVQAITAFEDDDGAIGDGLLDGLTAPRR
jgi:hypothetical protein